MTSHLDGRANSSAADDAFRLLAVALKHPTLNSAAKVLFGSLLCDAAFRGGWIVTKSPDAFVAEMNVTSRSEFGQLVHELVTLGAVAAKSENGSITLRLGPWSINILQLRSKHG